MRFALRTLVPVFSAVVVFASSTAYWSRPAIAQNPAAKTAEAPAKETKDTVAPAGGAPLTADTAAAAEEKLKGLFEKGQAAFTEGKAAEAAAAFLEAGQIALSYRNYKVAANAFIAARRAAAASKDVEGQKKATLGLTGALLAMKANLNELNSILAEDPNNLSALIARGQARLEPEVNQVEDALSDFEKAVKVDSDIVEGQFGLGKSLVLLHREDEAIGALTKVIEADPTNGDAHRFRGAAHSELSDNEAAISDLQQAIKLNPDDGDAYFSLGIAHFRKENYQAAADAIGESIKHYKPKSSQDRLPFLQGYLTRAAAYIELGKVAKDPVAQKAAYQAAADEAEKLVSQLDHKNARHARALAAALFSRGVAERMLGQLGPAIRTFTKAIEIRSAPPADDSTNPFLTDAYFRRGICFHMIGEDTTAISDFETAAHLDTTDPRANLWEGFTYAKLGDYQQALRAYGDAIAASDRFTPAYYNRGLSYMMMGNYKKAIIDFNDAIRLEPAKPEYYFTRGLAYQRMGDHKKASESFAAAIEFDNKHAGAHRHMADALEKLGRGELAKQYRDKAEQLTPQKKAK